MLNYNKMRMLAKTAGISLTHLCNLLSKQRSYLLVAERENRELSSDQIKIIADALNTTPEYLTDQTEQKEIEPVQDKLFEEYYSIFQQLTPEQKEREIAYIRSLIDQAK